MSASSIAGAIRATVTDVILSDWQPAEGFTVRVKQGFSTACWTFLPPHRMYVGTGILDRLKPETSAVDERYYIESYVHHEFSHARHTERDPVKTDAVLKEAKCPFSLYNLFEDARIEHLWRQLTGRSFRWSELETNAVLADAAGLFYLLIQGEGDLPTNLPGFTPDATLLADVRSFYERTCETPDSLALKPLLMEWIETYGADTPPNVRFIAGDELETAMALQTSAERREAFDADSKAPGDDDKEGGGSGRGTKDLEVEGQLTSSLLSAEANEVDFDQARALAAKFSRVFMSKTRSYYSVEPSKRFSTWRTQVGRPGYGHKELATPRCINITLVIDCSGSMRGLHIEEARQLAATLSILAEKGKIRGNLILSAVEGHHAVSDIFAWPVDPRVIRRIHAFGRAEGLQSATTRHREAIQQSEVLYVFTDGAICDQPLKLSSLRARGIFVCGLYVGCLEDVIDHLRVHFERFYVRDTLNGLVDALLERSR